MAGWSFGDILGIIGIMIGLPGVLVLFPVVTMHAKAAFTKNRVLVVGPPHAGKSSLIKYLQGRDIGRTYSQTAGYVRILGITTDITGRNRDFFRAKVLGELGGEFLTDLTAVLADEQPNGLIIVLADWKSEQSKKYLLDVLRRLHESGLRMDAILVLVNKADQWELGTHAGTVVAKMRSMIQSFGMEISPDPVIVESSLVDPRIRVSTDDGLRIFAQSLRQ